MKKLNLILILLISTISLSGCTWWDNISNKMTNTPTQKVEEYLMKYQKMDSSMKENIKSFFFVDDINDDNNMEYKEIIGNNYKKLTYDIKEEEIDGNTAKVKTEIEVISYVKTLKDIEEHIKTNIEDFMSNENMNNTLVNEYRLEKLKETNDKEKYTIEFELIKEDNNWILENINNEIEEKINGMYK